MTKRSNWCEFDKETRKYIKRRDKNKCILCGNKGALQIMHVFLSRAKGGKGSKENGCLGCIKCHSLIDNPIGNNQYIKATEYLAYCKKYLQEKENFIADKEFIENLKYKKQVEVFKPIVKTTDNIKRCKNCKMLVKNKKSNSTIPSYYCRYKKIRLTKNTKACMKYKEGI